MNNHFHIHKSYWKITRICRKLPGPAYITFYLIKIRTIWFSKLGSKPSTVWSEMFKFIKTKTCKHQQRQNSYLNCKFPEFFVCICTEPSEEAQIWHSLNTWKIAREFFICNNCSVIQYRLTVRCKLNKAYITALIKKDSSCNIFNVYI